MADVILVLNAGSSSIKFRAFDAGPPDPELLFYGQVEGLYTTAHFSAKDANGARIAEHRWEPTPHSATRARPTTSASSCAATARTTAWWRSATASCTAACSSPARPWSHPA